MATTIERTRARAPVRAASRPAQIEPAALRIYYLHTLLAGPLERWDAPLTTIARLGFSHVLISPPFLADDVFATQDFDRLHPALATGDDAATVLRRMAELCRAHGMALLLDVMPDHVAADGRVARERPDVFRAPDPARALDPRSYAPAGDVALARFDDAEAAVADFWAGRLGGWRDAGVAGFRLASLRQMSAQTVWTLKQRVSAGLLLGWTPGLSRNRVEAFTGAGLDYVFASLPWWDFRGEWLWQEADRLRRVARIIAPVEIPFGRRLGAAYSDDGVRRNAVARAAMFAAAFGDGWLLPMGVENAAQDQLETRRGAAKYDASALDEGLAETISAANGARYPGAPARLMTPPGDDVVAVLRAACPMDDSATLLVVNAALEQPSVVELNGLLEGLQGAEQLRRLGPGQSTTLELHAPSAITLARPPLPRSADAAARAPRLAIENVQPSVDNGRFAAKRVVGETVAVTADIVCDGHDQLGVALLWRSADESVWRHTRMRPLGNDRWAADLQLTRIGCWVYTVEAWRDAFATYRDELGKKHAAGVDIHLELIEGQELIAAAVQRVPALAATVQRLASADPRAQVAELLSAETARLMTEADQHPFAVRLSPPCQIDADRVQAQFAAWYEIFPRSMSDDPQRHGTFADVERHLPRIRDMGFDVLYFPPIHPIGHSNRKGRNNTLTPAPNEPGSPYAIGNPDGGHDAIHPELGTLDDFHRLRHAAAAHGMELALDFAIQCAPDHPWLKQHREWFDWRPDGSLRYAENPPKKYQDIVNVDFYAAGAVPDLWVALCEVVLFWAEQGVRIFRVDNPHTKPLPFWEWLIGEVRADYPDAIFLAEAFTKPKMMNRLGKLGFSQSYTYFTWRNTAAEMQQYLTELTTTDAAKFFRPNFFVNTPDINPVFLQTSGRPGFLIRAALAATLSGLWGVYSGFELCEAAALPGREEYADSEKYQLRAWDWQRPGNIVGEVAQLNGIRRRNPALHSHLGVAFLDAGNSNVLAYERATADRRNVLIVAVSFDPRGTQAANIDIPLWHWDLPDNAVLQADDLLEERAHRWQGRRQSVTLTPDSPYRIWRVRPA
jgi:starch synthase (maltosyl-transferring)